MEGRNVCSSYCIWALIGFMHSHSTAPAKPSCSRTKSVSSDPSLSPPPSLPPVCTRNRKGMWTDITCVFSDRGVFSNYTGAGSCDKSNCSSDSDMRPDLETGDRVRGIYTLVSVFGTYGYICGSQLLE